MKLFVEISWDTTVVCTYRMGIASFADLHNAGGLLTKYLLACHDLNELLGGIVILYSASFGGSSFRSLCHFYTALIF